MKPKHKGEDEKDIKTELVYDENELVPKHERENPNDIMTEMVTRKEKHRGYKEHR